MSTSRLALVAGLVAVAFLLPLWWGRNPAPVVRAAPAHRGPLVVEVATNGKVEPIEDIEVRARLDGRVVSIPDAGKEVRRGDQVLAIDPGPVAAELQGAKSERLASLDSLRAARDALARAQQVFSTDTELFEQGALTRSRYLESEGALREAAAKAEFLEREVPLRVASLDLRIAELQAQKTAAVIEAPLNGTIYRTAAKRGAVVHYGDPILWIADLERLRVRANVDQVDLGRVRKDQRVRILSNAYPNRSWEGRVSEVIPHVEIKDNRAVSESLALVSPPVEGLVPGMTVDVEIVVDEAEDALQVPSEAVFNNGNGPFVFKIEDGRARKARVGLGLTSVTAAEITEGLAPDDVVVLGPAPGLADGMRVDTVRSDGVAE